jgi:hypothetical protein
LNVRFPKLVLLTFIALLLPACEVVSLVRPGGVELDGGERLVLATAWSDVTKLLPDTERGVRVLSKDGPWLNRLYLAPRITPGRGLVKPPDDDRTPPAYRTGMTPTELVEFVSDSVAALGYRRVQAGELTPARLGRHDAIRMELKAMDASGLEFSALAQVAEVKGAVYLVLFLAPSEHYFPSARDEVERIMASTN